MGRIEFSVDDGVSCVVEWNGLRLDLDRVTAAYLRPYDPYGVADVTATPRDSPARRHAAAVYEALRLWGDLTAARVINRLGCMGSNNSKPYQAEMIRRFGFAIPDTIVTTDPDTAREFCERHGEVVYKSVSGVRSVVSRLTRPRHAHLDAVTSCPTQFQEYVPGVDYRVHVVGADALVCELVSTADDYRYADRQGAGVVRRQSDVPDDEKARCLALASSLGLPVAGIDLRRTPDGRWYCFEVNPSPAFSWFDGPDNRIARSIASLLAAPNAANDQRNAVMR